MAAKTPTDLSHKVQLLVITDFILPISAESLYKLLKNLRINEWHLTSCKTLASIQQI